MSKFTTFVRRSGGLFGWCLVDVVALSVAAWVLFSNYSGLRTAFALLGLDMSPLAQDPLLGSMFDAFGLGEATQADLYAGGLALGVGFGTFVLMHFLFRTLRLWHDREEYRRDGEPAYARMQAALRFTLTMMAIVIPILVVLFYWDVLLFRLRAVAGVLEIDHPGQTWDLPVWGNLLRDHGDSFPIQLAQVGAWGYLAATALLSFFLEWAIGRTQEALAGFEQALVSLFAFDPETQRTEVPQPAAAQTPAAEGVYEADGHEPAAPGTPAGGHERVEERHEELVGASAPELPMPTDAATEAGWRGPATARGVRPTIHTPTAEDPEFEVIGGEPGRRVRLSEALAQRDRYVVDSNRRRIWDRTYYMTLHGESDPTPAEAA